MTEAERLVRNLVQPRLRERDAYHVPDAGGLIKLDAMENPWPWPGELAGAWLKELKAAPVNRYPDATARRLVARLRATMKVPPAAALLLGNGSDELIQIILMAVAGSGRAVMSPEPSFVMYRLLAETLGFRYVPVALAADDFGLDMDAMLAAIRIEQPAVIFLAYPNNPTGNLFPREQVERILAAAPGLVVVDEAYTPFAGASFLEDVAHHPNLLVMRTVSKLGLAGLRLGWLAGPGAWVTQLDKVRLPYNINVLTQLSADFALRHYDVLEAQVAGLRQQRELLTTELEALSGLWVWPSRANFLLFRTPPGRARSIFEGLKARGVLVKCLDGAGPMLADCLRVTVSTPAENRAFLTALEDALAGG
ncbi:MAG: histidinol-phosphate transaminase [Gammaproteobacteria bacterium]|nr:histidinol-phosphate transaminase [Gammaproteobacteria bacterium]